MNKLVSVIVPAYNRADSIANTISSIISQEYRPLEIIIIDDGSTDNTREVVTPFLQTSEALSVMYQYQENQGVSAARNTGISKARGEFISFLDSDDSLLPGKIVNQVKILEHGADVCYGKVCYASPTHSYVNAPQQPSEDPVKQFLLFENITPMDSWMFSRSLIDTYALRFRKHCSWGEDNEFLIKALFYSQQTKMIDTCLVQVTVGRNDGLSVFDWDKADKDVFIYQKIRDWLQQQNISSRRKEEYARVIDTYTIPALVINRVWQARKEKKEAEEVFNAYPKYIQFGRLFNFDQGLKSFKLLVKYILLKLYFLT